MTGPNGGLTTVNQRQRHLSISDPDVHFIDIIEDEAQSGISSSNHLLKHMINFHAFNFCLKNTYLIKFSYFITFLLPNH